MRMRVAAVARSRLLHFCIVGGAIFALAPAEHRRVDLASATLQTLHAAEAARTGAVASGDERAREIDARAVEDELLYREALRLSLDRDDPIVRQRLVQKLLLLVEDLGGASRPPGEAELRSYFDATRARWGRSERIHLVHVFAGRREALPPRAVLPAQAQEAPPLGDPFPRARDVTATAADIERIYGAEFRAAVESLGGDWSDPVPSSLGWHRVRVVGRIPGGPATFEDVRKELELSFWLERREAVVGRYLRQLASSYDVRVDGHPIQGFNPTRRIAMRQDPSAED